MVRSILARKLQFLGVEECESWFFEAIMVNARRFEVLGFTVLKFVMGDVTKF